MTVPSNYNSMSLPLDQSANESQDNGNEAEDDAIQIFTTTKTCVAARHFSASGSAPGPGNGEDNEEKSPDEDGYLAPEI
jgi:hypothetical protein